jgi:hypothetical protein
MFGEEYTIIMPTTIPTTTEGVDLSHSHLQSIRTTLGETVAVTAAGATITGQIPILIPILGEQTM